MSKNPLPPQYERKMKVTNNLLEKNTLAVNDDRRQPLLSRAQPFPSNFGGASGAKKTTINNDSESDSDLGALGGYVEPGTASELSSQISQREPLPVTSPPDNRKP